MLGLQKKKKKKDFAVSQAATFVLKMSLEIFCGFASLKIFIEWRLRSVALLLKQFAVVRIGYIKP